MHNARVAALGGGNMARAIVLGAVSAGALDHRDIVVADPDEVKRSDFEKAGIQAVANIADARGFIDDDTQILLAVKPQILPEAAPDLTAAAGGAPRVVVSVLAGTTGAGVRARLGDWARVVRVMPNTPAQIGKGVSAITLSAGARAGDDELARALMASVGDVVDVPEDLFDAFTGVAGSGPAYVFYLAEAMTRAAVEVGLDPALADRVVRGVISGSAELLARERDTSAAGLRAAVTSKGGTTAAATGSLDDDKVMDAVVRAITAARDRGRELGG